MTPQREQVILGRNLGDREATEVVVTACGMVAQQEQTAYLDWGHLHERPVDATAKAMGCRMFHDGAVYLTLTFAICKTLPQNTKALNVPTFGICKTQSHPVARFH